ncbi:hypothetical protein B0H17DRAFT_307739 [Mycena rosella]|uniref:Uncharacterized protein n=1 Tax=Mycena rosella TaxID=1033263 RepID=A0AAD7DTI1_MYCRO|nr:hypothetical protein B0H17DRAFT_307739 [Mycena rosella]
MRGETKQVVWGLVQKSTTRNEILLPLDLAECIIAAATLPPPALAGTHRLLWSVALSHEMVHSLTKYLFPNVLIPLLPFFELSQDQRGKGESGRAFEGLYFGFSLQTEWLKTEVMSEGRMDKIHRLCAKVTPEPAKPHKSTMYHLSAENITTMLSAFATSEPHTLDFGIVAPYKAVPSPHNYGRYLVGGTSEEVDVKKDAAPDGAEVNGLIANMDGIGIEEVEFTYTM